MPPARPRRVCAGVGGAAALIRRPGVAILAQVLAGLVAIGTTSAIMASALAFLLYGVILELAHLVTRYRVWNVWPTLVAALLVGALNAVSSFALLGGSSLSLGVMIAAVASILVATVLWALLGRAIALALRRTGVGSFPAPARGR